MAKWLKVLLIIIVLVVLGVGLFFVLGTLKEGKSDSSSNPSATYEASTSDQASFELKKSSTSYTVYYHTGDDTNADKTLSVLEEAVEKIYKKYFNITPTNTSVYLASTVDEYVKVADFPGGATNVQVGDGSAPNDKIYLYKPFDIPEKGEGVIVHEGMHSAIYAFLGGGQQMEKMPGFLNEGMAYHAEYIHNVGATYDPLKEIYYADLLRKAVKTGMPALMSLDDLGKNCTGYISDSDRNALCRGQGTYTVWYMAKNYGGDFWGKFLADLKTSGAWEKSMEKISTKTLNQLGLEIETSLKSEIK